MSKLWQHVYDCSDSDSSSSNEEMQVVVQSNVIEELMKRRRKILIEENYNNVDKEGEGRAMWQTSGFVKPLLIGIMTKVTV